MFNNGYVTIENEEFSFVIDKGIATLMKCKHNNNFQKKAINVRRIHFCDKSYWGFSEDYHKKITHRLNCADASFDGDCFKVLLNNHTCLYGDSKFKIKALLYSFPELENSFQYLLDYQYNEKNNLCVENKQLKYSVIIDGKKYYCKIYNDIYRELDSQKKFEVKTFLLIESKNEITFEEIEKINLCIYRTFAFCSNRKNVKLGTIQLFSKKIEKQKDDASIHLNRLKLGEMYYNDSHDFQEKIKHSCYLEFNGFENEFGKIFQSCADGTIDTIYLPDTQNKKDLHFFVTYIAWFEKCLKRYIDNNPSSFPDIQIKNGKNGESYIQKNKTNINLEECLKIGFDLFWHEKILDMLIDLFVLIEIKNDANKFKQGWSHRLVEIRHAIIHRPIKEKYDRVYYDLYILELIIYYLSLRNAGVKENTTCEMLNNIFKFY